MNDTNIVLKSYRLANCVAFMTVYPGKTKKAPPDSPAALLITARRGFLFFVFYSICPIAARTRLTTFSGKGI